MSDHRDSPPLPPPARELPKKTRTRIERLEKHNLHAAARMARRRAEAWAPRTGFARRSTGR